MRALALLSVLALPGCSLFGLGAVETAVVTGVEVEALDLDGPWDGPIPGDRPDVYLDLSADEGGILSLFSLWRSDTVENAARLPLAFQAPPDKAILLDWVVQFDLADADAIGGDDLMFTTGPFTFADHYDGQSKGDTGRLAFDTDDGRIVVSVRWE